MFRTNPVALEELLTKAHKGKIVLPDFQRGWVWDDHRIQELLISVARDFPIGALLTLETNGEMKLRKRAIEGSEESQGEEDPDHYLLDGQQRLTSLYQALRHPGPVKTQNTGRRERTIERRYYLDLMAMIDEDRGPETWVRALPPDRIERTNIGRDIALDLSTAENEFNNHMLPTEQAMNPSTWGYRYSRYWDAAAQEHPFGSAFEFFDEVQEKVLRNFAHYQIPCIELTRDTSREAVCTVFEKVNTGGVRLSIFELATATMAAEDTEFSLRDDWAARSNRLREKRVFHGWLNGEHFLQTVALLATFDAAKSKAETDQRAKGASCKRQDILDLTVEEYLRWADLAEQGYQSAARFLRDRAIYRDRDLPYQTQAVSLATLLAALKERANTDRVQKQLAEWFWCGVFGEIYSGPTETLLADDLMSIPRWIDGGPKSDRMQQANLTPERLVSLWTRNSAAYKGVLALLMQNGASDWRHGRRISEEVYDEEQIDLHHIFPVNWCTNQRPPISEGLMNCILNKTPINASTNRSIGGRAPSVYLQTLTRDISPERLTEVLKAHWINPEYLSVDWFPEVIVERGQRMMRGIADAMGRKLQDPSEAIWKELESSGFIRSERGLGSGSATKG